MLTKMAMKVRAKLLENPSMPCMYVIDVTEAKTAEARK